MPSLTDLPLALLDAICDFVAIRDWKHDSLKALSLTSKVCCAAASRLIFQHTSADIKSAQQLRDTFDCLKTRTAYQGLRTLKIAGTVRNQVEADRGDTDNENPEWLPLAQFLRHCTGLRQFIWAIDGQLPSCIVDVLRHDLPRTQLEVLDYRLPELQHGDVQLREKCHTMLKMVRCPNLRKVAIISEHVQGTPDMAEDLILDMLTKHSPNMREVEITYRSRKESSPIVKATRLSSLEWRSCMGEDWAGSPEIHGQLTALTFKGNKQLDLKRLQRWMKCTDFSVLRALTLDHDKTMFDHDAFREVIEFGKQGGFALLRNLSTGVPWHSPCPEDNDDNFTEFLSFIGPLEELNLCHTGTIFFQHDVMVHNLSLKRLHVDGGLRVDLLRAACPNIEQISFQIHRSEDIEDEVRFYRTLGSLPRLSHLQLSIWYREPEVSFYDRRSTDPIFRVDQMRSSLRCTAFDRRLARQIFDIILHENRKSNLGSVPSFVRLEFLTGTRLGPDPSALAMIHRWICQTWFCARIHSDAKSQEVYMTETNAEDRARIRRKLGNQIDRLKSSNVIYLYEAWQQLWPGVEPGAQWIDKWHSFPLLEAPVTKKTGEEVGKTEINYLGDFDWE